MEIGSREKTRYWRRVPDAGVRNRTVPLATLAAVWRLARHLLARPGTLIETSIAYGQDRGRRIPAPDIHPLAVAVAPALLSPGIYRHIDLALAPVLPFREIKTKMRKRFYILIAIGILLAYSGLIEPNWIKVRTYNLTIKGLTRDITVVHLADIHTKKPGFREGRAIGLVERANPDYVFLSGDILKSTSKLADGLEFLSSLTAKRGVYVVPGNADAVLVKSIERGQTPKAYGNWRILMNENVDCGEFTLVGIDDPVTCRDDLVKAMSGVDGTKPIFVITHFHAKKLLAKSADMNAAMIFAGHTHGGQIGVGPLVSRIPYAHRSRFVAGLYKLDGTYLEVTRGVGTNLFPLRFLCRPEIAVFHLRGE
jgi:predicted MPP superfamily phosphohydrolase